MGGRNRMTPGGVEFERLPLPRTLLDRLKETERKIKGYTIDCRKFRFFIPRGEATWEPVTSALEILQRSP